MGTTLVTVTAGDGASSASTSFHWTLTDIGPKVTPVADQSSSHDQNLGPLTVNGTDGDSDSLTYTATIVGPAALAVALRNSLGISSYISTIDNYWAKREMVCRGQRLLGFPPARRHAQSRHDRQRPQPHWFDPPGQRGYPLPGESPGRHCHLGRSGGQRNDPDPGAGIHRDDAGDYQRQRWDGY